MSSRYQILKSRGFVLGLGLLLLNDFYLKQALASWFTGKLSDFSGLFIFPLLLTAVYPKQKLSFFMFSGVAFILWKLPIADGLIEVINALGLPISRTVDVTDLLALMVLPLSYFYEKSQYRAVVINPRLVLALSVFAVCATTFPPQQEKNSLTIRLDCCFC